MAVMNLDERKLELIQWLSILDDETLVEKVAKVRDDSTRDWWDEISDAEKESVVTGIKDADSGRLTPHSDAKKVYERWL